MEDSPGLPAPGEASCGGSTSLTPPGELAPFSILTAMSSWLCSLATSAVRSASCSRQRHYLNFLPPCHLTNWALSRTAHAARRTCMHTSRSPGVALGLLAARTQGRRV